MPNPQCFKLCPGCGCLWTDREHFLDDPALELNGYKADFEKLDYGLFFFTHNATACHSTLAMEVYHFHDLYKGEVYPERRTGGDDCPGYCLEQGQLVRCEALCECAFAREIIHRIQSRQPAR